MPSFKLSRVAKTLGIPIREANLHEAMYDTELTREVYRAITGESLL
jgi:DNA polymerase III epsilon subunit-like protein